MKYLLIGLSAAVISATAYAACRTYTILTPSGTATCTECCDNSGNCTVSCF